MRSKLLVAAVLTATAATLLAGCTPATTPGPEPEPTATTETALETPPTLDKASVPCKHGEALVENLNNKEISVDDCAIVTVDTSNARIALGDVDTLVVHGAINEIAAETVQKVTLNGDGNEISTTNKPAITDNGNANHIARHKS